MASLPDEQIQREVLTELKWDARVSPTEIGVTVKEGVVTLKGTVDTYAKKWAAEDAALRVRGVKAVANELEVRIDSASERTDADIAAAAIRALEWDAVVPSEKVKVKVSNAWVTLSGEVEWYYQKLDAERVVRRPGQQGRARGHGALLRREPRGRASGLARSGSHVRG